MNDIVHTQQKPLQRKEDIQKGIAELLITPLLDDLEQAYNDFKSKDLKSIHQLTQALNTLVQKTNEINSQVSYVNNVLNYLSQN